MALTGFVAAAPPVAAYQLTGCDNAKCSGTFDKDDDLVFVYFESDGSTPVTISTTSYAAGGFDPLLTLFNAFGQYVNAPGGGAGLLNDDADTASGNLDSLYSGTLAKGKYWVVLSESNNLYSNPAKALPETPGAYGFSWDGLGNYSGKAMLCETPPGSGTYPTDGFYDYNCGKRNGNWSIAVLSGGNQIGEVKTFLAFHNTPPAFADNKPVTLKSALDAESDLKPSVAVRDADSGQTLIWSATSDPNSQPLNGKLVIAGDAEVQSTGTNDPLNPPGSAVFKYVPNKGFKGTDSFLLQVSDGIDTATKRFNIAVATGQNPLAVVGGAQTLFKADGQDLVVTLDGSQSRDQNGNPPKTYAWTQVGGDTVAWIDDTQPGKPSPQFKVSAVNNGTVFSFNLVVTDSTGLTSSAAQTTVTVYKQDQSLPTAVIAPVPNVKGGDAVTLDGSSSRGATIGGQAASLTKFQWTAPTGVELSDPAAQKPTFVTANQAATLEFTLVVTDSYGHASNPAIATVTVLKKTPPEAVITPVGGPIVRGGAVKTLDATGSVVGGEQATYLWTAPAGVTLSNYTDAQPTFTAPASLFGQTLSFGLTVTTADGVSTQTVPVQVTGNNAPVVALNPNPITEGSQVTLTSNVSDPDGDSIATYRWEQLSGPPVVLSKVDGPSLSFMAPLMGRNTPPLVFSLSATDNFAPNPLTGSATVTLPLQADPSMISCARAFASISSLWPADKSMKNVTISGVTGPNPVTLKVTGVTSDEPVINRAGKDVTRPDARIRPGTAWVGGTAESVQLREERAMTRSRVNAQSQPWNGRVYGIDFTASDSVRSCTGKVFVQVPARFGQAAVDDGQKFDATLKR